MKKLINAIICGVGISVLSILFSLNIVHEAQANPETSEPEQVYKLSFALSGPPSGWLESHSMSPWFDQVKRATKGRVIFDPYYSGSLVPANAVWDGMMSNAVDAAFVSFHLWPGLTTLNSVVALPFLKYDSAEQQSGIAWKLYEQFPEIQNEYKANKLLVLVTSTPFFILTNNKQIKSREDLKGLKIRSTAGESIWTLLKLAGATPLSMHPSEIYTSMEKGVIDGATCNWDFFQTFRLYDLGEYIFHGPFNTSVVGIAMSNNAWNKLPSDVQDQLMTVCGYEGSRWWGKTNYDESSIPAHEKIKAAGKEMKEVYMTENQINDWMEKDGQKAWDNWIEAAKKKAKREGYSDPEGLVKRLIQTTQELIGKSHE